MLPGFAFDFDTRRIVDRMWQLGHGTNGSRTAGACDEMGSEKRANAGGGAGAWAAFFPRCFTADELAAADMAATARRQREGESKQKT